MLFHVLQVGLDTAAAEVAENIARAAEPAMQAAPQQVEQSYSLIQMAAKGGWLMIVLAILSVIAMKERSRAHSRSVRNTILPSPAS